MYPPTTPRLPHRQLPAAAMADDLVLAVDSAIGDDAAVWARARHGSGGAVGPQGRGRPLGAGGGTWRAPRDQTVPCDPASPLTTEALPLSPASVALAPRAPAPLKLEVIGAAGTDPADEARALPLAAAGVVNSSPRGGALAPQAVNSPGTPRQADKGVGSLQSQVKTSGDGAQAGPTPKTPPSSRAVAQRSVIPKTKTRAARRSSSSSSSSSSSESSSNSSHSSGESDDDGVGVGLVAHYGGGAGASAASAPTVVTDDVLPVTPRHDFAQVRSSLLLASWGGEPWVFLSRSLTSVQRSRLLLTCIWFTYVCVCAVRAVPVCVCAVRALCVFVCVRAPTARALAGGSLGCAASHHPWRQPPVPHLDQPSARSRSVSGPTPAPC